MQIAICDDIQKDLEKISAALEEYAMAHPALHFEIDRYSRAEDILNAIEKGKIYDIALLDICMPGILGTDIAKEMLSQSPDMSIIFLTTSDEYAVTAFALNATHYLLKPFTQEEFEAALDRAVRKMADQEFFPLDCVDGVYRVRVSEIAYAETQGHYLSVYLVSGEILRQRRKLSELYEEIQKYPEFIRVGASYIANLGFVRKISANSMEMMNGAKISIPRRCGSVVQKAYMDFCRKEALK